MTIKKLKLAWIENEKARAKNLKKIRVGLMKKVKELTILCDVMVCIIMFSPYEVDPMVWPSVEKARDLLHDFFALSEIEKKKKDMNLESYLKEKTEKVHEQFLKIHKKHMGYVIDHLMVQLHRGRRIDDLDLSEIYALISFSKDNIILRRKELEFVQYSPLCDPPVPPFEARFEELRTTTNDVFVSGGQVDERAWKTDEETKRISIGNALRGNQSQYLIDKWVFPSPLTPKPRNYQQIEMGMVSYNKIPNHVLYQGNSSNETPNLDIEPVRAPVLTFHGLVGSVSQQLQDHSMLDNPTVAMRQPKRHPYDFMSREFGVKEERSTVNNGDSQFNERSNTITINNGIRQEPPLNGTIVGQCNDGEGNADVRSFDINKVWSSINNQHF